MRIRGGLEALFASREDVFVAGSLPWHHAEGDDKARVVPDVMVVFGRSPKIRDFYRQWEENGVCPHIVFEVFSTNSHFGGMMHKLHLYERLGVEECYVLNPGDPDDPARVETVDVWWRPEPGQPFEAVENTDRWRSPRLDVVFENTPTGSLRLIRPDGRPFETFQEFNQRAAAERLRAAGIDPGVDI